MADGFGGVGVGHEQKPHQKLKNHCPLCSLMSAPPHTPVPYIFNHIWTQFHCQTATRVPFTPTRDNLQPVLLACPCPGLSAAAAGLLVNWGAVWGPGGLQHAQVRQGPPSHPPPSAFVAFSRFMGLDFCAPVSDLLPPRKSRFGAWFLSGT